MAAAEEAVIWEREGGGSGWVRAAFVGFYLLPLVQGRWRKRLCLPACLLPSLPASLPLSLKSLPPTARQAGGKEEGGPATTFLGSPTPVAEFNRRPLASCTQAPAFAEGKRRPPTPRGDGALAYTGRQLGAGRFRDSRCRPRRSEGPGDSVSGGRRGKAGAVGMSLRVRRLGGDGSPQLPRRFGGARTGKRSAQRLRLTFQLDKT